MKLSPETAQELRHLSSSHGLRDDLRKIKANVREVSAEQYIEFVTTYNELIDHTPRKFRKIIDTHMAL